MGFSPIIHSKKPLSSGTGTSEEGDGLCAGAVTYLGEEVAPEVGVDSGAARNVGQEGDEPLHFVQHRVGERHVLPILVRGPASSFDVSPNLLLHLFWKEQTQLDSSKEASS